MPDVADELEPIEISDRSIKDRIKDLENELREERGQ